MNILVTPNEQYIRPLFVMLDSLFAHNAETIDLYMFYSNVSEKSLELLHDYFQGCNGEFYPIFVAEEAAFQDKYYPPEVYYRILCSTLLPKTLDRVLYLDVDILIRGRLDQLYKMKFNGKSIIGVLDYPMNYTTEWDSYKRDVGLPEWGVINSGVLLFNLEKMRREFLLSDFIELLWKKKEKIRFADQDMINLYFCNDILLVNRIYDYVSAYRSWREKVYWVLGIGKRMEKVEPVVLHYPGGKPWKIQYTGKYFGEYYRYLKKRLSWTERICFMVRPYYICKSILMTIKRRIGRMFDRN